MREATPQTPPCDFYVAKDRCIACGAPEAEALALMGFDYAARSCCLPAATRDARGGGAGDPRGLGFVLSGAGWHPGEDPARAAQAPRAARTCSVPTCPSAIDPAWRRRALALTHSSPRAAVAAIPAATATLLAKRSVSVPRRAPPPPVAARAHALDVPFAMRSLATTAGARWDESHGASSSTGARRCPSRCIPSCAALLVGARGGARDQRRPARCPLRPPRRFPAPAPARGRRRRDPRGEGGVAGAFCSPTRSSA